MSMHDSGNEAHQLHDGEQGLTTSPLRTMVRQFLIKTQHILRIMALANGWAEHESHFIRRGKS